jgi:hypothetical protein
MKKVCVNVSGLFVEIVSPGHDEIRRVPVLQNASAVSEPFEQSGFRYAV